MTEAHLKMIKKLNVKVLLATDGDKAGLASAFKSAVLLSQHSIDGGVAIFKEGDDPADMVASGRVEELKETLKQATKRKLIPFVLDEIANKYNLNDAFDKSRGVEEALEFLKSLKSTIGSFYVSYINKIFNVNVSLIERPTIEPMEHKLNTPVASLADNILYTLSEYPWLFDEHQELLKKELFRDIELYEAVISCNFKKIKESGLALLKDICLLSEEAFKRGLIELNRLYTQRHFSKLTFDEALKNASSF